MTSFSRLWPAKSEVAGGGAKLHAQRREIADLRRAPRDAAERQRDRQRLAARIDQRAENCLPGLPVADERAERRLMLMWILSGEAKSGFSAAWAGAAVMSARKAKGAVNAVLMRQACRRCAG